MLGASTCEASLMLPSMVDSITWGDRARVPACISLPHLRNPEMSLWGLVHKCPVSEFGVEAYSNSNNTVGNSKGRQEVKCQLPSIAVLPTTPTKSLPFVSQPPFCHQEDKGVGSNRICFTGFTKI